MSRLLRPLLLAATAGGVAEEASIAGSVGLRLQTALEEVARHEGQKYNCSISIALRTANGSMAAASGIVDFSTSKKAQVSDMYPWGSVTKMLTASSIMKLVSKGAFKLDDEIAPLVDPIIATMAKNNPKQNFSSVGELWGQRAAKTTVRELLGMQAGIPDFDTAKPSLTGVSVDPLRKVLYAMPKRCDTPVELMSVPWVAHKYTECKPFPGMPFGKFCYSSTNFMLLGLVLAANAGDETWVTFNQSAFLPPELRSEIHFANRGSPRDWDAVPGYDRTAYNVPKGQHNDHDNWEVDGVFSGWTASNLVATPSTVAELTWQIFGPPEGIAPKEFVDQMIPKRTHLYGLGAFNIGFQTGHMDALGVGYGHLGATYGYQSVAGYFPELNIALSVASNIETDNQVQPSDTVCLAYNAVAGILLDRTYRCQYTAAGYYGGRCACKRDAPEIVV
uniref:Beta-lactamase-related domain-containing protein n=1 Tax=Alexandrium monilatum TaxID=311494 RepID=A0A7S4W1H0_9DINO